MNRGHPGTTPVTIPDPEIERWPAPARGAILIAAGVGSWAALVYLLS